MDTRIKQIFGDCSALIPPARIELDRWLEDNINLPAGVSAVPGRFKLWPFQREICQAITDPTIERVTLVKPVRVGFTTLLTGAVGHFVENDPSPVLCVLPIETDCRSYLADELEPIFEASGININQDLGNRDTMLARRFLGGSLRIIPSRSPGRLRKLTCRILMIDEVDGMEVTREGDPVRLSINRTMTFRNRKIIMGSTPVFLETSAILRAYSNSDRRVFQVPCPSCGIYNQILWKHIVWENRDPSTACYQCPDCNERIDHKHKVTMVTNGVWKARKPEIANHAGFHLNSLVSLLYNTRWEVLVEEFLEAKQDPELLQTFINTILAEGWAGVGEELDVEGLKDGVGDFSLESMPEGILYLTAGVDVQRDRLEVVTIGWDQDRTIHVLDQRVIWGDPHMAETWKALDDLLLKKWKHPAGGEIGLEAVGVDSGDGFTSDQVLNFCQPRLGRRVFAIKGASGSREAISRSKSSSGKTLHILGVDGLKANLHSLLNTPGAIRFSNTLEGRFYEELASEKRHVTYKKGIPQASWVRIGKQPGESLDCMIYAMAVEKRCNVDPARRSLELRSPHSPKPKSIVVSRSSWIDRRGGYRNRYGNL